MHVLKISLKEKESFLCNTGGGFLDFQFINVLLKLNYTFKQEALIGTVSTSYLYLFIMIVLLY